MDGVHLLLDDHAVVVDEAQQKQLLLCSAVLDVVVVANPLDAVVVEYNLFAAVDRNQDQNHKKRKENNKISCPELHPASASAQDSSPEKRT